MIIKSRNISLKWFHLNLLLNLIASLQSCTGELKDQSKVAKVSVKSQTSGKDHNLELTKIDKSSVLHSNIKVIHTADTLPNETYDKDDQIWLSSKLKEDGSLYIDHEKLAVVRLAYDIEKGEHYPIGGIVNGNRLVKKAETDQIANITDDQFSSHNNQSDYIDYGKRFTPSKLRNANNPAIVELLIVCDKEFGDKFNHDQKAILDYWTIYFWDINMRYRTLPNVQISFQINSILTISSKSEQPFIEQSRGSNGRIEFGQMLSRFSSWIYSKQNVLPKFDMAIAVTGGQAERDGGLSHGHACWTDHSSKRFMGTAVLNGKGDWGSVGLGAHEIGHVLGAPHDDDPNFPGGSCSSRGYIMMEVIRGSDPHKWHFSPCSDRKIREFVNSEQASCLKRLDETSTGPEVYPFNSWGVKTPSMDEQCRQRLNNQNAVVWDKNNCKELKCGVKQDNGGWLIWTLPPPVENSNCLAGEEGKCFRGRCRTKGKLLMNVGSGQCAIADNTFYYQTPLRMRECPIWRDTPLEQFSVEEGGNNGNYFMTPWNTEDGVESGEKCLYTGGSEGDGVWTDKCGKDNPWQGWEMNGVEGYEGVFLLRHKVTGRCAKQRGSWVESQNCDGDDRSLWWGFVGDGVLAFQSVVSG